MNEKKIKPILNENNTLQTVKGLDAQLIAQSKDFLHYQISENLNFLNGMETILVAVQQRETFAALNIQKMIN